jgi:hypothetical protein
MTPASYVRGSSITFRATCLDAADANFSPTRAMLTLSYVSTAGQRVRRDVPMAIADSVVSCVWDSSQASDAMPVAWHIRASGGANKVAQDGAFTLSAAQANPTFQ